MLSKREIVVEVCMRASVPVGRFLKAEITRDELRAIMFAAQSLSEQELLEFDDIMREICRGTMHFPRQDLADQR